MPLDDPAELLDCDFTLDRKRSTPSATPIKSAMKSYSATPVSAVKVQDYQTPVRQSRHRRSVSFSDGKREGPIRGLGREELRSDVIGNGSYMPSARSKRITAMIDAFNASGKTKPLTLG